MNICFPVTDDAGLESQLFEHFGSAPMFLIVDQTTGKIEQQVNRAKDHDHAKCQPLKALAGLNVDVIVVAGIGKGALNGLNRAGLKVLRAQPGTIADNLAMMAEEELAELTVQDACGGHSGAHGAGHSHDSSHQFGCGF